MKRVLQNLTFPDSKSSNNCLETAKSNPAVDTSVGTESPLQNSISWRTLKPQPAIVLISWTGGEKLRNMIIIHGDVIIQAEVLIRK